MLLPGRLFLPRFNRGNGVLTFLRFNRSLQLRYSVGIPACRQAGHQLHPEKIISFFFS